MTAAARRQAAKTVAQLLSAKDIVIACGPGRRGQDHDGRRARRHRGGRARRPGAGAHGRPGAPPGRRARARRGSGTTRSASPTRCSPGRRPTPGASCGRRCSTPSRAGTTSSAPHAPDAETREQILANPLYQNISGRFVQSHDYIAMERLYEIHSEGKYDLIVVDTPPTRNALDFLDAPQRMADFFSSRLLRWLIVPYRSRLVNIASKPFYQVADRILGTQFLADISEFFILFQSMYDGLRRAGRGGDAAALGPPHHVHGRLDPGGHAGARGRVLLGRADGAQAASRRHRAQQGAARLPARRPARTSWPSPWRAGPPSWPTG